MSASNESSANENTEENTEEELENATKIGQLPDVPSGGQGRTTDAGHSNEATNSRVKAKEVLYVSPLDRSIWVFFGGLVIIVVASTITRFYNIALPPHIA